MIRSDYTVNGQTTMIYDGQESNIQAIVNTGYANIYGFTAQMDFQLNSYFNWKSSITRVKGYDNDGLPIRHAPPLYGSSKLTYEKKKLTLQLNAFYNGEIAFEELAATEISKAYLYAIDTNGNPYSPSWFTIDFKSTYAFSDSFLIHFDLENLMDIRYRNYKISPYLKAIYKEKFLKSPS